MIVIYILIRYSILTVGKAENKSAWKIGRQSYDDYKNELFDQKRLQRHEDMFRKHTVPSISEIEKRLPAGVLLKTIVMTSDQLPESRKKSLLKICSGLKRFEIYEVSESENYSESAESIVAQEIKLCGVEKGVYATVRLDDDDALSCDFARRLSNLVTLQDRPHCISFPKGYLGFPDDKKNWRFEVYKSSLVAQGLTYVSSFSNVNLGSSTKTIYSIGNHKRVDETMPVVLDSKHPVFIWSVYDESDSSYRNSSRRSQPSEDANYDQVLKRFPHLRTL